MNETILNPLWAMWVQFLSALTVFMPKLIATLVLLLIGITIARTIKFLVVRGLEKFRLSTAVKKTPIEHFFDNPEMGHKVEEAVGSVIYWLVMLVVLHTVFTIIGLNSLSLILEQIINYLPHVISATFVLFFGVILAGLVESFVKGTIKTIDGKSARLFGKISSYVIVTIAVLAAVSELGIAKDFVTILFIGFVATFTLALGLAFGLGGQHIVREVLESWYEKTKKEIEQP